MLRRVLLSVLLGACAADPQPTGLVLEGVVALDDHCVASTTNALRAAGVLDTTPLPALRSDGVEYRGALRFENVETAPSPTYPQVAIPRELRLTNLLVEIRRGGVRVDTGTLPNPFLVPLAGGVGFGSGDAPAHALGGATFLPAEYGAWLGTGAGDDDIELWMRASALTLEGEVLNSTSFVYALHICRGCLVDCSTSLASAVSCELGQDDPSLVACE